MKIFHGKDEIYSEEDFSDEIQMGSLNKVTKNGKVYFTVLKDVNKSAMKSVSLNGTNGSAKDIAEDVGQRIVLGDDFYYVADTDSDGNGTLYKNEKKIADDVHAVSSVTQNNPMPFLSQDYDEGSFTLGKLKGSRVTDICEDVSSCNIVSENSALIMYDKRASSGDCSLGYYNGKKLIPIDDGVLSFFNTRK